MALLQLHSQSRLCGRLIRKRLAFGVGEFGDHASIVVSLEAVDEPGERGAFLGLDSGAIVGVVTLVLGCRVSGTLFQVLLHACQFGRGSGRQALSITKQVAVLLYRVFAAVSEAQWKKW